MGIFKRGDSPNWRYRAQFPLLRQRGHDQSRAGGAESRLQKGRRPIVVMARFLPDSTRSAASPKWRIGNLCAFLRTLPPAVFPRLALHQLPNPAHDLGISIEVGRLHEIIVRAESQRLFPVSLVIG